MQGYSQPFVVAVLRHVLGLLGLPSQVAKIEDGGYGHTGLPLEGYVLRGFDALTSGLLLTPLSLTLGVVAPLSGTLADSFGSRWLAPSGLAIACLGLLLLSQLTATSTLWDIIWRLVLTGIGQGLFQSPNTRALMSAAPRGEQGEASGILSTARVIGLKSRAG